MAVEPVAIEDGPQSAGRPPARGPLRLAGLAAAAGFLLALASLAGFGARWWWGFELASHFRVQYALGLGILALGTLVLRDRRTALVLAGLAALNAALVAPRYAGRGAAPEDPGAGSRLRVMLWNVHRANTRHGAVTEAIREEDPDLLMALEVDGPWLADLRAALPDHRYVLAEPRSDNFGIAILSRLPLDSPAVVWIGGAVVPSVVARLRLGGRSLTVVGIHTLSPGGSHKAGLRNGQLAELARYVGDQPGSVLVLGDLNCTPWSPYFDTLLREGGLEDGGKGWGVQATWPALWSPLRIPIDHCLHSGGVRVVDRYLGRACGSDHLPLVVDLIVGGR